MYFVSVTRLRIRSVRFLPSFARHIIGTRRQIVRAQGFQDGSLMVDRAWTFWTMTMWDSQDSMRQYMTTGAHRTVMPRLLDWCDEASIVHWDQSDEALPPWPEAGRRMRESGRASKVRYPSPQHATLSFQAPRVITGGPIRPVRT